MLSKFKVKLGLAKSSVKAGLAQPAWPSLARPSILAMTPGPASLAKPKKRKKEKRKKRKEKKRKKEKKKERKK